MNQELMDRIDAYLLDQMSDAARQEFELQLARDEELQAAVDEQRRMMEGIALEGARQTLAEVMSESPGQARTVPLWQRWQLYTLAAAAVALLLVWVWSRPAPPPEQLYAAYFEAAPGLPTTLGATDAPAFAEGMVAYRRGDYAAAIAQWEPLRQDSARSDTLDYYLGISHLAERQFTEAEPLLRAVATNEASPYQTEATWYLALGYLRAGRLDAARVWLDRLPEESSLEERAEKLREELEAIE